MVQKYRTKEHPQTEIEYKPILKTAPLIYNRKMFLSLDIQCHRVVQLPSLEDNRVHGTATGLPTSSGSQVKCRNRAVVGLMPVQQALLNLLESNAISEALLLMQSARNSKRLNRSSIQNSTLSFLDPLNGCNRFLII